MFEDLIIRCVSCGDKLSFHWCADDDEIEINYYCSCYTELGNDSHNQGFIEGVDYGYEMRRDEELSGTPLGPSGELVFRLEDAICSNI